MRPGGGRSHDCTYSVVLHPHVEGLLPSVLDGAGPVPAPQGVWRKLAAGQVGGASLLVHLGCNRKTDAPSPITRIIMMIIVSRIEKCLSNDTRVDFHDHMERYGL